MLSDCRYCWFSDHSDDIKQMLLNPHLCDMIENIEESSDPARALRDALDIPIYLQNLPTPACLYARLQRSK